MKQGYYANMYDITVTYKSGKQQKLFQARAAANVQAFDTAGLIDKITIGKFKVLSHYKH